MTELVLGLVVAAVGWLVIEIAGCIAGELLQRPIRMLFGPPAGKYLALLAWSVVAILSWMSYQHAGPHWADGWAWLGFFLAGVVSLLVLVSHAEQRRQRSGGRRGA